MLFLAKEPKQPTNSLCPQGRGQTSHGYNLLMCNNRGTYPYKYMGRRGGYIKYIKNQKQIT
jgi:hypothetical protein